MKEREYVVIFEQAKENWAAYAPDVPGCVATGRTKDEAARNFAEALEFHFEGLLEDGLPIPEPSSLAEKVKIVS